MWTVRLPGPVRRLAHLWWKLFSFLFVGNYLAGLVLALVQSGWSAFLSALTSWGFLAPIEKANPPAFWASMGLLAVLAMLGFIEEGAERQAAKAKSATQERTVAQAHDMAQSAHGAAQAAGAQAARAQMVADQALAAATARLAEQAPDPQGPPDDRWLLPAAPRFVGREGDLRWVMDRLRQHAVTSITALGGLGGIGKTALAAEAVRRLREEGRFADGVAMVVCTGLTDPGEVLRRVLARFDVRRVPPRERAPDEPEDVYLAALAGAASMLLTSKDAVVVLDNVEPGLPVATVAAPLRAARVAVLITARQVLSAGTVDPEGRRNLDLLPLDEAIEVFAEYYGRGALLDLTPGERRAAEAIVTVLGRHTLAIKLAATYARDVRRHLETLARELADPTRALALPEDEVPGGVQRSFQASVEALPTEAQRLFVALAAFATNEFGREAALALGAGLGLANPDTALDLLVRRALLQATTKTSLPEGADRERRVLHPLLRALSARAFALWTDEERAAASHTLAEFFATYVTTAPIPWLTLDEINITRTLEWAHTHAEERLEADLCWGLAQYWRNCGKTHEALRYLPPAIDAAAHLADDSGARTARMRLRTLITTYGQILSTTGQLDEASTYIRQAIEIDRDVGDRHGEGVDLRSLGQIALARGHLEEAASYVTEALAIHQEGEMRREQGVDLSSLGQIALARGHLEEADGYFQQSLALRRVAQDRRGEGLVLSSLGQVALARGRLEEADAYFQQSLAIRREVQDRRGEGADLFQVAIIAEAQGDLDHAETLHRESLAVGLEVQAGLEVASSYAYLGEFLITKRGKRAEGCVMLAEAARLVDQMGVPGGDRARETARKLGCERA
jgi:tetratricopeptide (TPR) repeat protein